MAAAWDQLGARPRGGRRAQPGPPQRRGRSLLAGAGGRRSRRGPAGPRGAAALRSCRSPANPAREVVADQPGPDRALDRVWIRTSAASPRLRRPRRPSWRGRAPTRARQSGRLRLPGRRGRASASASPSSSWRSRTIHPTRCRLLPSTTRSTAASPRTVGGSALADFVIARLAAAPLRTRSASAGVPTVLDSGAGDHPRAAFHARAAATAAAVAVAVAVARSAARRCARSLVARIPALEGLTPRRRASRPGSRSRPEFTDALFWDLAELDQDVIVPGLGEFPQQRVRLLAVNGGFVGAYLVGVNHAMALEFLWREYPTDLSATFFARFFDYGDELTVDIEPDRGLEGGVHDQLQRPQRGYNHGDPHPRRPRPPLPGRQRVPGPCSCPMGRPATQTSIQPSFEGRLGSDVLVVGFPSLPRWCSARTAGA